MSTEHITASPVAGAASSNNAEWHVIHGGKELGPMSLAELIEKAGDGEIEADDLVKQTGGLWTKAREFAFLEEEFLLRESREEDRESREEAVVQLGQVSGIWLSQKVLTIGLFVGAFLISFIVAWLTLRSQ